MARPDVVSQTQWQQARAELLAAEKEVTRAEDAVAAKRRRLPMVQFRTDYTFETTDGPVTLLDLFDGHSQLVTYQFMDIGPDDFCAGCTKFTRGVPPSSLEALAEADVAWRTVSDMPLAQLEGYWNKMSWEVPFASSRGTSWSEDTGAGGMFLLSVFLRDGDDVFRTYDATQRGVDRLVFSHTILDLLPFGRQEDWEDSPAGWPQHPTYG